MRNQAVIFHLKKSKNTQTLESKMVLTKHITAYSLDVG